ncbi:hypothetical protein [Hymenobacter sp. 102]|uniref:hypothetical protein n=1 Tax=Hymenobacter sp. 102 TaxID=3403152 RepID=UPI003CF617C9
MKKVFVFAAFVFAAGAAQAQVPGALLNPNGTANSGISMSGPSSSPSALVTTRLISDNDSYVRQVGDGNYGNVRQIGQIHSADLLQNGDGNDGWQEQKGEGSAVGVRNRAFTQTNGDNNVSAQKQEGDYNRAEIMQDGDRNYAIQHQVGDNNQARIDQDSNFNYAIQKQDGDGNFADTYQGGSGVVGAGTLGAQWSATIQQGDSNAAIVHQDHN